ncbi:cytochrome c biogenesis CcdA family protein [Alkalihalophilus pseudofirmus]|uniref:cytochrome c biogenesis CcdA family protein n=1 Tax=Alkalihalophilus pseudofirmus TaxID=79885 RepID=UPI00259B3131|nr:cytochrome c biogenesis CcdA family protein [Alkalihalophilus pseudofirmus]WEG15275.1 cytochrome c biogenesis CcdA family protein [Alkalihalophilus pseudofirmus]
MEEITIYLAFAAGVLAFLSPCTLPLYPSFISYITGVSVHELKTNKKLWKITLAHSSLFCVGFSIIYYVLGFSASLFGRLFIENQMLIQQLGGIFLVLVGLFLVGVIEPKLLMSEWRIKYRPKKVSYINTFLIGLIFSAGWTACIGPIFSAIMYSSVANPAGAFVNVTAFSLGFSVPFIAMGFAIGKVRFLTKYSAVLMKIGGVIMIILGVTIFFNKMYYVNIWGNRIQQFFSGLF